MNEKNPQVLEAEEERKNRAQEAMNFVQHPFWKYLSEGYIGDAVKSFSTTAIITGFKDMDEFNAARGEVLGLRKLVGRVNELVEYGRKQNTGTED